VKVRLPSLQYVLRYRFLLLLPAPFFQELDDLALTDHNEHLTLGVRECGTGWREGFIESVDESFGHEWELLVLKSVVVERHCLEA
jgi:hypothetical protein